MAKAPKAPSAKAPTSKPETATEDTSSLTATEAPALAAVEEGGAMVPPINTLPGDEAGSTVKTDTQGAPAVGAGPEPSGSEPSTTDAPGEAAAPATDAVLAEGADPSLKDGAGESGKASEEVPGASSEPTHRFLVMSAIEHDGEAYHPGSAIPLNRTQHAALHGAGAIVGTWPEE